MTDTAHRSAARAAFAALLLSTSGVAYAQTVQIVQPGAPGQASKTLTADQATKLAQASYTASDVAFMQHMIVHHQQAVEMAVLVKDRTNTADLLSIAGRIESSQADEIAFMKAWLSERGEPVEDPMMKGHGEHMHHMMKGMASADQIKALAAAKGVDFDRQFLTLMIAHHEGAVDMVEKLLDEDGTAADPVLYQFVGDIDSEQATEIKRMDKLLAGLSGDPRSGLAAGFDNAGEAILNLTKVATLPKPAGFFNPANPADLRPPVPPKKDKDEAKEEAKPEAAPAPAVAAADPAAATPARQEEDLTEFAERSPLLDFANTDIAFFDDVMVAGSYHGFNIYKLGADGLPNLMSSVVCPGGQGDVSVVGNILVMSVEQTRGRVDCGLEGAPGKVNEERFRGLRIFDISDLARPVQVGGVQTCRGSHTHSIVSADSTRIVVYNSGTAGIRETEELAGCIGEIPGDTRTALFSIDVIEIPLADPSKARIVKSPRVFADEKTGSIAGLWTGGDHGDGTQRTAPTDQCHDITVFPALKMAAGACSGNGLLFDIADPLNPKRIDAVTDTTFAYWHSATFNNDGTKVIFTDEWGGGGRPRCKASDPKTWGANAIYDIVDRKLVFRAHYKMPAPQTDKENCVAHNGSIVPVPGRDLFVQAWYQGGLSIMDFTDSATPKEIAYFDRGPIDMKQMVLGGYWSVYWYKGHIYGTEITRGIDVFTLKPSEHLTEAEIAAAEAAKYEDNRFNPQTQTRVTWDKGAIEAAEASRKGG
ncbi:uncharacterized protein (DUF305 family) [Erythromicrobium ramosum]|uniref:DUF305 domain-containing protein n=1 Tax=Erythrobacter ramosus TaxID=35811 RepID=A0A6I4UEJ7_9SPHN|nr:DUF305 domain-containing protein [Erythrobacter ramosus]MBB3774807.1 uncharacterized protein (DUF305 family) [Erythrobacter ramosus]MXP37551.1 DUF305 domain-containing protein [Erythrobacter ramosus]